MKKHYRNENNCLNCGAELQGHFCHVCGQENLQLKENFGHLVVHVVGDYFHFDEKFFHTLKPLFLKPGKLTIEYMEGRRTQYLHPIRMYIFISLIYFLLVFSHQAETRRVEGKNAITENVLKDIKGDVGKDSTLTPEQKKKVLDNVDKYSGLTVTKPEKKGKKVYDVVGIGDITEDGETAKDTTYEQYLQSQSKLPADKKDDFFNRLYHKKKFEWKEKRLTPSEAMSEGFKHNFPKLMFLLLPLFAFLVRIAFWRNHKFYVEHLIYTFHLFCFIFLFLSVIILLKMAMPYKIVDDWIGIVAFFTVLWYIYRSMRVIYNRSRWRTVSKMFGISMVYSITAGICALLFLIGVAVFS